MALEAVANVSGADSQPFLTRWLRTLWQLFWSTIPVYILAVLLLGAARVWLFPMWTGRWPTAWFGWCPWRLSAPCL